MKWTESILFSTPHLGRSECRSSTPGFCAIALIIAANLAGCANVHLYDPSRTATARLAVEQRESANLEQVTEDATELLDTLLQNEIDAAAAANKFLFENDIFRIAASKGSDETLLYWIAEIDRRLKALGFDQRSQITDMLDNADTLNGERQKLATISSTVELISPDLSNTLPECSDTLTASWPPSNAQLEDDVRILLNEEYDRYKEICEKIETLSMPGVPDGLVVKIKNKRKSIANKNKKSNTTRDQIGALKKKIEDETKIGAPPSAQLKEAVEELRDKIKDARKVQQKLGVDILSDETIDSIGVVLASLAGEEVPDPEEQSAKYRKSIVFLSQVPSLADSAAAVSAQSEQPAVAHLIIELNRQLLQQNYFQRTAALDEQGLAYLEDLARALRTQSRAYRDFVNALCNYGYSNPGLACDGLEVKPDQNNCTLPSSSEACPLNITWADALDDRTEKKRHIYAAIVALSNAHRAAARAAEIEYRVNDLQYRKALLTSENAIAQWDNLIRVPVEQIAAFYEAGIKPETVGDFIVKALALTSIAIAVENN